MKTLIVAAVALTVVGTVGCCKTTTSVETGSAVVPVGDLVLEYQRDADRANAKYRDRRIRVQGIYKSKLTRDDDSVIGIALAGSNYAGVRVEVRDCAGLEFRPEYDARLRALTDNQNVSAECTVVGKAAYVMLNDCILLN